MLRNLTLATVKIVAGLLVFGVGIATVGFFMGEQTATYLAARGCVLFAVAVFVTLVRGIRALCTEAMDTARATLADDRSSTAGAFPCYVEETASVA